ncbi:response regulator transcription factor [Rhodocytophaga rosea]|uniref:Response regulator transcription factor n=1 Tax=Rhodocytophaga rosea TaxID=2704465 RepID=A0A6C0GGX0_9BACT|nr:response regulator transcription factor [Rhodocytophaga rosea]QHT66972.1 response regulator transcription factor [Rhodocytophaga rosea]
MNKANVKLKVLLVDDEPYALDILERYLQHFDEMEITAKCSNALQAFQILQKSTIDLLFLDIKMPGLQGTELIRSLKNPPKVIFTTAFQDYAVEGFELNAVDYLLKPVSFPRFLKAIDKVFALLSIKKANKSSYQINQNHIHAQDAFVYLKVERKTVKINVADIVWIESQGDYIKVKLKEKVMVSKHKISLLEELLPEDQFIRIHRSYIVSIAKIESFHSNFVEVQGIQLPIGRSYKEECINRFKTNS